MDEGGEGKEWEGWEEVLTACAAVGSVAASMRMVWTDRNRVWCKVEVALVEQQSGEAREGLVAGRGVWRLRAQSLVESVEEWLASNEAATDQAIRDLDGGGGTRCPYPEWSGGAGQRYPDVGGAGGRGGKSVCQGVGNAPGVTRETPRHRSV